MGWNRFKSITNLKRNEFESHDEILKTLKSIKVCLSLKNIWIVYFIKTFNSG